MGTGNYHPGTARLYTDISLLTAERALTEGISGVFNYLTSHSRAPEFGNLMVGPVNFLDETLRLIRAEEKVALEGRPASISAKMNALIDRDVIEALYAASRAGVRIRLMVRGICALRPGVKGMSENIEVRSVLGRFLEHSRIYRFGNGGDPLIFIGSGDWMTRNLRERVEVLVPIADPALKERLEGIMRAYWADTAKAVAMQSGEGYVRVKPGPDGQRFEAQAWLMENPEGLPPEANEDSGEVIHDLTTARAYIPG